MIGSCAQTTRMNNAAKSLKPASPTTFLEKPVESFQLGRLHKKQQSNVQTQKSREFPGCRIIHTFSQRITPPEALAARRGMIQVNDVSRLGFFQVTEEVAAWVQDHDVGFVREAFTVGTQATVETVELLILAVGLGVDCSGLGITVTANLF